MIECRVIFESDISEEDVTILIEAIKMFKGVFDVETDLGATGKQRVSASLRPPPVSGMSLGSISGRPEPPKPQFQESFRTQRHVIDEAIKWGVHNHKISVDEIRNLSAEEIVQQAFRFIDMMPEQLRAKLGEELSVLFGNDKK